MSNRFTEFGYVVGSIRVMIGPCASLEYRRTVLVIVIRRRDLNGISAAVRLLRAVRWRRRSRGGLMGEELGHGQTKREVNC